MIYLLALSLSSFADSAQVRQIAVYNGYNPSKTTIQAISKASQAYKVPVDKLTAIAIAETGLGKYKKVNVNKNGTKDVGLFQINDINRNTCIEYNLHSDEGSALCAAKLLNLYRKKYPVDYYAVYHSKTKDKKVLYKEKIDAILKKYPKEDKK